VVIGEQASAFLYGCSRITSLLSDCALTRSWRLVPSFAWACGAPIAMNPTISSLGISAQDYGVFEAISVQVASQLGSTSDELVHWLSRVQHLRCDFAAANWKRPVK
jgi:hypothetical protein